MKIHRVLSRSGRAGEEWKCLPGALKSSDPQGIWDQMHHPVDQCNYFSLLLRVSFMPHESDREKKRRKKADSRCLLAASLPVMRTWIIWESGCSIKPQQVTGLVCIVFSAARYTVRVTQESRSEISESWLRIARGNWVPLGLARPLLLRRSIIYWYISHQKFDAK